MLNKCSLNNSVVPSSSLESCDLSQEFKSPWMGKGAGRREEASWVIRPPLAKATALFLLSLSVPRLSLMRLL